MALCEAKTEEVDEGETTYEEVDKLQSMGINVSDINKLKEAGINTVGAIMMTTKKQLAEIRGLSEAKVGKIAEAAVKLHNFGFSTGTKVLQKRRSVLHITTGSSQFDELLGGGLESMAITEVFGEFRTGKTQLCHTMCVTAQLPYEMKGGNGKIVYIDTEGTFRPKRIISIAERFGVDPMAVLDNIVYARAYTHEQQLALLTAVSAQMISDHFALLIVDSVTALFRVDFQGRGELATRQQMLGLFMSRLTKISEEFNVAVLISNQVVSDPGAGAMFVADSKKPIGGHILAHASTTRISLRKGRGDTRVAKIFDSPCLPEAEAIYGITEGGIDDAKD